MGHSTPSGNLSDLIVVKAMENRPDSDSPPMDGMDGWMNGRNDGWME